MKHAHEKYDRIQDPEGKIPEDEPVFLLRGQDIFAADVVEYWAELAEKGGVAPERVKEVLEQAKKMREWKTKKIPG